jgi:SPP1 gp7 family putative phage head morphogenesis protein
MPKYAKLPDASDDFGHEETDRILGRMEKKISKEYKQAEKELTEKLEKYLERFEAKDKVKRQQLAEGVITQDEYNRWRIGQVATGERWKAMRDTIAEEITKANDIAKSTINSHAEEVYSLNHNYAVYQAEKDAMIDTSYTLYNRRATEELFKNKQSLLPAPKEGSKAWKAAHDKDLRWNQQKINSSLIQGLLQGDSIPQIAKRLKDVVGMNKVSAVRNARTMTTGVENRARDDAVNDLRKKGIELDSVWIATLDNRTRHSHRLLHGEIKDLKTGKYSNGCRYPADPQGKPEEVYNCRCSQRSNVRGFPIDIPRWSPKMEGMTFEEWLGVKEEGQKASILAPDTEGVMKGVPKLSDVSIKNILKGANPDYNPDKYDSETHENCAFTSVATELRAQGYDVYANHRTKENDVVGWYWWNGDGSLKKGKGSFTDCFDGLTYENAGATRSSNALKKVTEKMEAYGENSRAIVWIQWKGTSSGHYFNAMNSSDGIHFIDGQNNKSDVSEYFEECKPSLIRIFRTDNHKLTDYVHKVVSYDKDK